MNYDVGSRDERKGRTGFAHLFEHMMFKGSENVGPGEHPYLMFMYGGSMNGTTNKERTLYFEILPSNQLDLALFLGLPRRERGSEPAAGICHRAPGKSAAELEAAIDAEIEKVKTGPIADWEIEKARNDARRNAANLVLSSLQRAIQLAENALFYDDPDRLNTITERTQKVTAADVQRAPATYLTKENRSVIITVPKPAAPTGGQ